MKIAITGKGGVGKTTLAAGLGIIYSRKGLRVILIDADPDANLQFTLGIEGNVVPLVELKSLIQERTGAEPGKSTFFFKLNPKVDDIPEKFFLRKGNILLGVMGTVRGGGLGCTCPENAFLKALLRELVLSREEVVILDMEAGIEHLGRATTQGVNWLVVVTEPGEKSVETAFRIKKLAQEIGIKKMGVVGNKVRGESEKRYLRNRLKDFEILGLLPYSEKFQLAELEGIPPWEKVPEIFPLLQAIIRKMEEKNGEKDSRSNL